MPMQKIIAILYHCARLCQSTGSHGLKTQQWHR